MPRMYRICVGPRRNANRAGSTPTPVWQAPLWVLLIVATLGLPHWSSPVLAEPPAWAQLPPLPDREGFAGPFAGKHGGALIVAGGANFPDKKPWEGGAKVWYDHTFVLEPEAKEWQAAAKLPRPLGYGVSLSTPQGLACLGGSDADRHYADGFLLRWTGKDLATTKLPSLPQPVANACGALIGNTIYVAGGLASPTATTTLKTFYALQLDNLTAGWQTLEPWPGPQRMLAVAASDGRSFYLIGGTALSAGPQGEPVRTWLQDAYRYVPKQGWQRLADMPRPAVAAPTPAPWFQHSHLLILGGDDGQQLNTPPTEHRGFPRNILAFNVQANRWESAGSLPFSLVTTVAVADGDSVVIPGGEARPGIRSTQVWRGNSALLVPVEK